jgi:hypothetical protein
MAHIDTTPTSTPARRRWRRRPRLAAILAGGLAAATLVAAGPTQALDPSGTGPRNPKNFGFPHYYTDDAGRALQLCVDGSGRCDFAKRSSLQPPEGEAFYFVATATLRAPGINLDVEWALEAAWAGRKPFVFDRLRIRGHVNAAGTYNFNTPYGRVRVTAADPVEDRNVNFTQDVGSRGSFRQAARSPRAHITEFMVSDKAFGKYLGNPGARSTATVGGKAATLSVTGPAGRATTDKFFVMGKRAHP